jgi:hypothetical protein
MRANEALNQCGAAASKLRDRPLADLIGGEAIQ